VPENNHTTESRWGERAMLAFGIPKRSFVNELHSRFRVAAQGYSDDPRMWVFGNPWIVVRQVAALRLFSFMQHQMLTHARHLGSLSIMLFIPVMREASGRTQIVVHVAAVSTVESEAHLYITMLFLILVDYTPESGDINIRRIEDHHADPLSPRYGNK
jgi:hypothetical protein